MSRLPTLTADQLDPAQKEVWDDITSGRRGSVADLTDESGGLIGPFNAMLFSPRIGARVAALGEALRFDTSLDRRLVELATITVAAHWRSNFEWFAHSRYAAAAGVTPEVIDAVRRGDEPSLDDEVAAMVHRFTQQVVRSGEPDAETYAAATDALGESAVVELVMLIGYYCLISFTLNAFAVGLPGGEQPAWPR
jgi:4-carboxymuconolactone decarboxylase